VATDLSKHEEMFLALVTVILVLLVLAFLGGVTLLVWISAFNAAFT
jgi:nitrate reductase NapE component